MIEGRLLPTSKDYQVVTTRLYWKSTSLIWYFESSNYNNAYEKELFTDSKRKKSNTEGDQRLSGYCKVNHVCYA